MCGIVGVIAKGKNGLHQPDINCFSQMLFAGQLRGIDGVGLFFDIKENILYCKEVGKASDFVYSKNFGELEKTWVKDSSFIIGHNRSATKGSINRKNTHPFKVGDITLVHNGTLYSHKHLADTEVDSEAITSHINEKGIQDTVNSMSGAYALVYFNKKDNSLNVIRNLQRPLHIIETDFSYILCSELEMGMWIASRNKQKVLDKFMIKEDMLGSFSLKERTWSWKPVAKTYIKANHFYQFHEKEAPALEKKSNIIPIGKMTRHNIGETISFYPTIIKAAGNSFCLEGYVDEGGDKESLVKLYNNNKKVLEEFLLPDMLCAVIKQVCNLPKTGEKWYVVRDAFSSVVSGNKILLLSEDIVELPDKCECCDGFLNKGELFLKQSIVIPNHNSKKPYKYKVYCPDCHDFYEKTYSYAGGY